MKKFLAFLLSVLLISGLAVTAFAATPEIMYDASYNDDTNTVTVSVYVKNAVGTESADLDLAYDETMFEFQSVTESGSSSEVIVVADKAIEAGLCTCSFLFTESCAKSDLDENGNLQLAEFVFKPVSENFDINDFCLWATSYDIAGGENILSQIKPQGDTEKQALHTNEVTVPRTGNDNGNGNGNGGAAANNNVHALEGNSSSGGKSSNWYVYVIAGVLVIAAIAGIALIAVKGGREDEEEEESDTSAKEQPDNEEQQ